jgi:2-phospho-L-lactate guanylyltransferase
MPATSTAAVSGSGVGAVVALKTGEHVKSRLAPLAPPLRRRLAWTMAVDTLGALTRAVEAVCVVSDQPSLQHRLARAGLASVVVVPESRPAGMNDALRQGAERLRSDGLSRVLACVGDLPALRPASVAHVLGAAAAYDRAFVPDATGIGTTMLHAADGVALAPHFQGRSAAAHHSSGAIPLTDERLGTAVPDARRDVDTEVDLLDATGLGLGDATRALVDPVSGRLGAYSVVTTTSSHGADGAVTAAGVRVDLPGDRLADGLRALRPGQRLHAVLVGTTVLSAWI